MSQGIDSEESIPPAYVAWRAGTTNRVVVRARQAGNRFLGSQIWALQSFVYFLMHHLRGQAGKSRPRGPRVSAQRGGSRNRNGKTTNPLKSALIKKNIKFYSYIRKFRMEQLKSHI